MRKLSDLFSVGPESVKDLDKLGVRTVEELAACNPELLFKDLCRITASQQDPCVLDIFRCAVAQARNPELPKEQTKWWYWSRLRKRTFVVEKENSHLSRSSCIESPD